MEVNMAYVLCLSTHTWTTLKSGKKQSTSVWYCDYCLWVIVGGLDNRTFHIVDTHIPIQKSGSNE